VNTLKRRALLNALKIFDLMLSIGAFGLATIISARTESHMSVSNFLSIRVKLWNVIVFALILLVWHVVFCSAGLYESKRLTTPTAQAKDLFKAATLAVMALAIIALSAKIRMVSRPFLVLFWTMLSALLIGGRLTLRYSLGQIRRRGRNLRHILILGSNARAILFARRIEARPELGYRILGFADQDWSGLNEVANSEYNVICSYDQLARFLRHNVVDEVANFLPIKSFYEDISRVSRLCEQHGITMRLDPDIFNLKIARTRAEEIDGAPQIAAYSHVLDGWPLVLKRIFDIIGSLMLLVLLSPLFLVVALLIKATSAGPVLFSQERMGLNKRKFRIFKFRTMVLDAEKLLPQLEARNEVPGPVFKITNDPRITPVGRFLRRTSIDEFPQLLNVLIGDMSLVGPRPLPVRDYLGFNEDWHRRRLSVRPGITCLWQVNGRSSIEFEQWMKLDMQYVDEWSFWLDVKILARTIPAVVRGVGAV
jgi:exopolysaccharide biosynthesis polyprenyl glycosylphosphotransferase